jgi:hypothetical protein
MVAISGLLGLLAELMIQGIQWTVCFNGFTLGYMQINHGGGDIGMPQKVLQGTFTLIAQGNLLVEFT